ncbi:GIY-YIG nuclease family protein [Cytobacillus sp. FSL W7-1323]|uniref:GIY-YIG nuclease family protein n=1 Tax=Cytobacillus sp. FSL W7-1323 TaxID=2921700 RepID=UPI0031584FCD
MENCGVYFFREKKGGLIKIGRSVNWKARLQVLDSSSPYEVSELHTIKTRNYLATERVFQRMFNQYNVRKEWFDLPEYCIQWIRSGNYDRQIMSIINDVDFKLHERQGFRI